jgi:hypothetical protein
MGSVYFDGTGGKTCLIDKIVVHPNWNPATSADDVALIRMDCKVDFTSPQHSTILFRGGTTDTSTDLIRPIRLPVAMDEVRMRQNQMVTVSGFGQGDQKIVYISYFYTIINYRGLLSSNTS